MRSIADLSFYEMRDLLERNGMIRDMVWSSYTDYIGEMVDGDVLWAFEHRTKKGTRYTCDYEVGYCGARMHVAQKDYAEFVNDCLELESSGIELFFEGTAEKLKSLREKADDFECGLNGTSDVTDEEWNKLEKEFDDGIDTAVGEILQYCRDEFNAADDADSLADYACTSWAEQNARLEVGDDGITVYETVLKTYA